jgi:phage terminase small subunit
MRTTDTIAQQAEKHGFHQRRTRFIKEFIKDQNATRAARAAGYSEKTAKSQGQRLLTHVYIREAIEKENAKINAKLDITVERVKEELARLAFYDPGAYWNPDGSAKPFSELDENSRRAIAGFEMAELFEGKGDERNLAGYIKKFKLADKGANLERLGRHLQMFPTKVDVNATLEIHRTDESDLNTRIADLERDLGLARTIDEAGRIGSAQAREGAPGVEAKVADVLPGNGAVKA